MKKKIILLLALASIGRMTKSQVYLSENFESGAPASWTQTTLANDGGWLTGNSTTLSSQYFAIPAHTNFAATNDDGCNCNKSADRYETPSLNLAAAPVVYLKFDTYYGEGTYNNVTEDFDIVISTDGGTTWSSSIYDVPADANGWKTYIINISAQAAGQANVKIGFLYSDGGGWLFGAAIDNVEIYTPPAYDASVTAESMPDYLLLSAAPFSITGTITNYGSQNISNVNISYSVNGGAPVTATNLSLSATPLQSANFTHPTGWTPSTTGTYTIKAWVDLINGNNDQNNTNDTLTWTVNVVDTMIQRQTLMEVFTSSTCPPCAPANASMEALLPSLSNYTVIKYQQDFPGAGDPYSTSETVGRRNYYGINSIPRMEIDGQWDQHAGLLTQAIFNQYNSIPSFMSITIDSAYYSGTNVTVKAIINPVINYPAGTYRYHVVIVEKQTTGNVGTNGETQFFNVCMDMIPNQNGNSITSLTANNPILVTKTANMSSTHVEQMSDLRAVVFVQNNNDKKVLQSAWKEIITATGLTTIQQNVGIYAVFPNPANEVLHVKMNSLYEENAMITIYDLHGRRVLSYPLYITPQPTTYSFAIENLESGVYVLQLTTSHGTYTSRFVKK